MCGSLVICSKHEIIDRFGIVANAWQIKPASENARKRAFCSKQFVCVCTSTIRQVYATNFCRWFLVSCFKNIRSSPAKYRAKAIQSIGKDARMRAICSIQCATNLLRQVHEKAFRWSLVSVALKIQIHWRCPINLHNCKLYDTTCSMVGGMILHAVWSARICFLFARQ